MRTTVLMAALIAPLPLWADNLECLFTTECYEQEACQDTAFPVFMDIDGKVMQTQFGDLTIVAVKEDEELTALFATGDGAEYLSVVTEGGARLNVQMHDGPQSVTYMGACSAAE